MMNIQIIEASKRKYNDIGWLQSYFLFSFGDYYDPENSNFGALRVFNDDSIKADTGFDMHPHRDMEIVTIVLDGAVTHEDSLHNRGVTRTFEAQAMTAGTGIVHSEHNKETSTLKLYQVWFTPSTNNLRPSYSKLHYKTEDLKNTLFPIASGLGAKKALKIKTPATLYRSTLDNLYKLHIQTTVLKKYFIYVTTGAVTVDGRTVKAKEQARIETDKPFEIQSKSAQTDIIFIEIENHIEN